MWAEPAHRLALLELWARGELRKRDSQAEAWSELSRLGWARRTSRRDVLALEARDKVELLLSRCWPAWRQELEALEGEGLSPDPAGWKELTRRRRVARWDAGALPERLNRRTALAAVAEHSKAELSEAHHRSLGETEVTRDGLLRVRPNAGLTLTRGGAILDACQLALTLGELSITERALRDGTRLSGRLPRAVLLLENRGAFVDLPAPADWLLVHVPGWDTPTVPLLYPQLAGRPWILFGDLDPNGVRIQRHLRKTMPDLAWFVPDELWRRYLDRAQVREWPLDLVGPEDPPLVQELALTGLWLEQELLVLDEGLLGALERFLSAGWNPAS